MDDALLLVCLGILAHGYFYYENSTCDLAGLFISNLGLGMLICIVFHVVTVLAGRKQAKKHAFRSFLAIYGSLIVGGIIGYYHQNSVSMHATHFSTLIRSTTDPQSFLLDNTTITKGESGEIEKFMKVFMNEIASQRNDYSIELNGIGWDKILAPERLKADKSLIESNMIIQKCSKIVDKYRTNTFTLFDNALNDIYNLNISEDLKRRMATGFEQSMVSSKSQIDEIWDLELASHF